MLKYFTYGYDFLNVLAILAKQYWGLACTQNNQANVAICLAEEEHLYCITPSWNQEHAMANYLSREYQDSSIWAMDRAMINHI